MISVWLKFCANTRRGARSTSTSARHQEKRGGGWKHQGKDVYILSLGELKDVYEGVLVANHTVSHPSLADISIEQATREVREGRERLEQHFGYAVEGFAYPNGSHSPAVHDIVREAGHLYARTCENADFVFSRRRPDGPSARSCHFMAEDFWARFEKVKAADGVFLLLGPQLRDHERAGVGRFRRQDRAHLTRGAVGWICRSCSRTAARGRRRP